MEKKNYFKKIKTLNFFLHKGQLLEPVLKRRQVNTTVSHVHWTFGKNSKDIFKIRSVVSTTYPLTLFNIHIESLPARRYATFINVTFILKFTERLKLCSGLRLAEIPHWRQRLSIRNVLGRPQVNFTRLRPRPSWFRPNFFDNFLLCRADPSTILFNLLFTSHNCVSEVFSPLEFPKMPIWNRETMPRNRSV